MIKYLECPDIHFDTKYEEIGNVFTTIGEAANKHNVDFIAMPGDLFNRPIYATESGGLNRLRDLISNISNYAAIVAIEGTKSHDAPGCYKNLQDCGVTILHEESVCYLDPDGYIDRETLYKSPPKHARLQLLMIPENIASKNYIKTKIAPARLAANQIPSICLFHGNVTDSTSRDNVTDIVLKNSDVLLHTDDMAVANITRWSLGHIHKPWESEKICAGYAGSWGKDWKETGFVPGFNLIEIDDDMQVKVSRIPYVTPKRLIITKPLKSYDKEVAYLLKTDDEAAQRPDGHPLSDIVIVKKTTTERRISSDVNTENLTLVDLFKIADKDVKKSVLKKVEELEKNRTSVKKEPKKIILQSINVEGCVFFKDKKLSIDCFPEKGLYELNGVNGSGKSSVLSFCSPYPVIIGKDTLSGRNSAIKDFFNSKYARIDKHFFVNDESHFHTIIIKGAHTQSAKVECYLTVNGIDILELHTFDEMMSKCEELYGPYPDYLLTTFYVQPQQGSFQSGLMSAKPTEIRDLVQSIAGIDRDCEKKKALENKNNLDNEFGHIASVIEGMEYSLIDLKEHEEKLKRYDLNLFEMKPELEKLKKDSEQQEVVVKNLHEQLMITVNETQRKKEDADKVFELQQIINELKKQIEYIENNQESVEELQKIIDDDKGKYLQKQAADEDYSKLSQEFYEKQKELDNKKITARQLSQKIADIKDHVERISKPCEKCGEIPYGEVDQEINNLKQKLNIIVPERESLVKEINETKIKPMPDKEVFYLLSNKELEELHEKIKKINNSKQELAGLKAKNIEVQKQIDFLLSKKYDIKENAQESYDHEMYKSVLLKNNIKRIESEINTIETQEKMIKEQIEKAKKDKENVENKKKELKTIEKDLEDWAYISKMLQPSKVPAIELELMLDDVDQTATEIIQPFHDGAYYFQTRTQEQGKKDVVDRFDIKVHNGATGVVQSFTSFNPGHKAFLNDAYVKALAIQRNKRLKVSFSPIILDEADGPIDPTMINSFYEMQTNHFCDSAIICVSHSPASQECIENKININEVLK